MRTQSSFRLPAMMFKFQPRLLNLGCTLTRITKLALTAKPLRLTFKVWMTNTLLIIRRVSSSLPCAGQWKFRQALWVGALKSIKKLTNWSKNYWLINQLSVNQLLTQLVAYLTPRMISAQPMWKSILATKPCSSIRIIRKSWKLL